MTSIYNSQSGKDQVQAYYEAILETWPTPNEKIKLATKFGETFAIFTGRTDATPMILIHGSGSNSAMWKSDVIEYSKLYRVIALDIPGECGKSSETRINFKDHLFADWLNEILNILKIHKAIIVGCSLGGWIALDFSITFPGKVIKLVLMAAGGVSKLKISSAFLIAGLSVFGLWGIAKINKLVFQNVDIGKEAMEFSCLLMRHYKPRTEILPLFKDLDLKKISAPIYFIGGENDCFYNSKKTANRLCKIGEKIKCDVLAGVGHVIINQTQFVLSFLEDSILANMTKAAESGTAAEIDYLMEKLTCSVDFATTRFVDYSIGLVENSEGIERLEFYLFNGTKIQRNYASLFFNRRDDWKVVKKAFEQGLIDEIQAFSR